MGENSKGLITALVLARFAWIVWTGSASALQSSAYGNAGPVTSWDKIDTASDRPACTAKQKTAIEGFLRAHPQAVKRKEDIVYEKKAQPGDEEMVVHTVTRFICLPDGVDPAKAQPDKSPE